MTRSDFFKVVRSGVRDYRRARPDWHKRGVSGWLLKMMQANTQATLEGNWSARVQEQYFYKMVCLAVLCMDDNGAVPVGNWSPTERIVRPENTDLDIVLLSIDRGCAKYVGQSATDLAVMINYHLSRAVESQPQEGRIAYTLEEIRDIASLATLGLETKPNGDYNG